MCIFLQRSIIRAQSKDISTGQTTLDLGTGWTKQRSWNRLDKAKILEQVGQSKDLGTGWTTLDLGTGWTTLDLGTGWTTLDLRTGWTTLDLDTG